MENMDMNYNVVGVIKSQVCSSIVNSESVRKALDFKGVGENCKDYDSDDPFTLIYNCVIPWLQHPDTITTTEPLVFVGVKTSENSRNPYLLQATVTIICSVDKDDMRTSVGYFRNDLLENGCVCYTRADWIADEIIKCISSLKGTWIGDIENIGSPEYAMSSTRYARSLEFRLKDVNIGKLIQNG
jgi:hypothetical protein